ncbi:MAG: zinc ribbon domain-containing protein [Proteobacteria bacterium]|nr:zinc ribbon domain-containing protein [Pseudomonadota bacterium]
MALKKCKECGKEVSTKADLCPHCGAKQKGKGIGCGGALLILIVIAFIGSQFSEYSQKAEERKQAARQEEIRKQENEKRQNEKKAFEESIESHYTELVKLDEQQQFDNALVKVNLFKKFGKTNYKDVSKYHKTISTQSLSAKVRKLPVSDIDGNLKIYKELLALNPNEQIYKDKVDHYQKKWDQYIKEKQEKEYRASCQLVLVNSRWSEDYGYATYEGQVKNISSLKLENVQAVVTWYDRNDNMITSSSALIEYNPILPGQSSPFKVMKTYNPAMQKAGVEFSHLMGGTIRTYREK